jgi:hypothetical protein
VGGISPTGDKTKTSVTSSKDFIGKLSRKFRQDSEKTLLSAEDNRHLMRIKAGDPCKCTYLRNLKKKKTLPLIDQMIKLVINKGTGHNQFHGCHPCGDTQKVKLLKSSGWAWG